MIQGPATCESLVCGGIDTVRIEHDTASVAISGD